MDNMKTDMQTLRHNSDVMAWAIIDNLNKSQNSTTGNATTEEFEIPIEGGGRL